jgi:hypothetical protein
MHSTTAQNPVSQSDDDDPASTEGQAGLPATATSMIYHVMRQATPRRSQAGPTTTVNAGSPKLTVFKTSLAVAKTVARLEGDQVSSNHSHHLDDVSCTTGPSSVAPLQADTQQQAGRQAGGSRQPLSGQSKCRLIAWRCGNVENLAHRITAAESAVCGSA